MAKRTCPIGPEQFIPTTDASTSPEGFYQSTGSGCLGNPDFFIERRTEEGPVHVIERGTEGDSGTASHFMDPGGSWGSDICGMY